jgi:hypothetical protein
VDQVKQILAVFKKYHFWVLCGLVFLMGLGVWWTAVGSLADRYKQRESKLTSQRNEVSNIAREPSPPNQAFIDAIKQAHEGLKDEVAKASAFLYQMQKANNPWPVQVLGEEFVQAAEALKPGENYMKPGEEFKDSKYLDWYQNFISRHLPKLGLIADVRERKSERQIRVAPPEEKRILVRKREEKKKAEEDKTDSKKTPSADEGEDELVGTVYWDNELAIVHRYDQWWETRPTTMQVLIAQEDIWVYEALLRIIHDTNGESPYFKAPVKRIVSLEIGQEAAKSLSTAMRSSSGGGPEGSMPSMAGMAGAGGAPGMMGPGGAPGMTGGAKGPGMGGPSPSAGSGGAGTGGVEAALSPREAIAKSLLDGRYVDLKGQPLAYGTDPPYPQFKMMPVRMVLVVDQRRISTLLAQCANSSMPVEVKRVSLRFEEGQSSAGAKAGGGTGSTGGMTGATPRAMPGAMPSGMPGTMASTPKAGPGAPPTSGAGASLMGGASLTPGSGAAHLATARDEQSPWDTTLELEGIIYIFNPPDTSKLGLRGGQAAAAGAPDAVPGAAPTAPGAASPAGAPAAAAAPPKK